MPVMDGEQPKVYRDPSITQKNKSAYQAATAQGLISNEGVRRKGVGVKGGQLTKENTIPAM